MPVAPSAAGSRNCTLCSWTCQALGGYYWLAPPPRGRLSSSPQPFPLHSAPCPHTDNTLPTLSVWQSSLVLPMLKANSGELSGSLSTERGPLSP